MARPGPAIDEERLPWLEPYRDKAVGKPAPVKRGSRGAGLVVGGVAALAAALTAGYYLGQRDPGGRAPTAEIAVAPTVQAPIAPPVANMARVETSPTPRMAWREGDEQARGAVKSEKHEAKSVNGSHGSSLFVGWCYLRAARDRKSVV